eukprot:248505-Lingulodinium_polyedra.AAC.1
MAVARDIGKNEDDDILNKWKVAALPRFCKFVYLPAPMGPVSARFATVLGISHTHSACHRSCYQGLDEMA